MKPAKPQKKTLALIQEAQAVLHEHNPMTLRQVFYQLVSRQVIENKPSEYDKLSRALVIARQENYIPWEWIEDRTRRPSIPPAWGGLDSFLEDVKRSYRRDVWKAQPSYFEVWLEKDALSGIFEAMTSAYGVTLQVGRGYTSWSALYQASCRFNGKPCEILYFGDFDPSGEDIARAIEDNLGHFGTCPKISKVAINRKDIDEYHLPPVPTKDTDTRQRAHVEKYGDVAVELDALPLPVLRDRIKNAVEDRLDMEAFREVRADEQNDNERLAAILGGLR